MFSIQVLGLFTLLSLCICAVPNDNPHLRRMNEKGVNVVERAEDHKGEKPKRSLAVVGAIISAGELGVSLLNTILTHVKITRTLAVGVANELSTHDLVEPTLYISSGTIAAALPRRIKRGKAALIRFDKTSGAARGAVGTFTYKIEGTSDVLVVYYCVPYDYNLYSNYYNVRVVKNAVANADLEWSLYHGSDLVTVGGTQKWEKRNFNGVKVEAFMTNSGKASLQVFVKN